MPITPDGQFGNRADAHINLSNSQVQLFGARPTTESMLYSTARFTAWFINSTATSRQNLEEKSVAEIDQFVALFREMLEANVQELVNRRTESEAAK